MRNALALLLVLLPAPSLGAEETTQPGEAASRNEMLLELADRRPPCADADSTHRCYGTRARISTIPMKPGVTVPLHASNPVPPAFVRLKHLWIDTLDLEEPVLTLTLTTGRPHRLVVADGHYVWAEALDTTTWRRLDLTPHGRVWARLRPSVPDTQRETAP